jgi:mannose-1-phosphate guanylyltransferase/mannose-6-phosphate isomerase
MKLISVVLSGGAGARLWPVSRQAFPKPFMKLGGSALLEQAIARGQACGADDALIVTNQDHLFLTQSLIGSMTHFPRVSYLLEPAGRNTAPAIALAALVCEQAYGSDAVMLVLPADHLIPDTDAFVGDVLEATRFAQLGQLVVFGINPTSPETGFGYIEVETVRREPQPVRRFVEKPDLVTAQGYLAAGRYYWNSGVFCFTAKAIIESLDALSPEVSEAARKVLATSRPHKASVYVASNNVACFDEQAFASLPDISLDYAVMERAPNVTIVPAKFAWSDVGTWPAVADAHTADGNGNTFATADRVDCLVTETLDSHFHIDSPGHKVVAAIGVEGLVIVDTPDALLVTHKKHSQRVKSVVDQLRRRESDTPQYQATITPAAVHRPWGTFATISEESNHKVKKITVRPGQSLSLQYHRHRAEHWVVVKGRAVVQVGDGQHKMGPGEYCFVPTKEKHRLTNMGSEDLILIEVQCGDYLGEDDIVRLADTYGRV